MDLGRYEVFPGPICGIVFPFSSEFCPATLAGFPTDGHICGIS
jgi:hypothetical protein